MGLGIVIIQQAAESKKISIVVGFIHGTTLTCLEYLRV
jgi:hypothetical protein